MLLSLNKNKSNCPGSEVILELLRAEHEQVKQRTEIIKELIGWNCNPNGKIKQSPSGLTKVSNLESKWSKTNNTFNEDYQGSVNSPKVGQDNKEIKQGYYNPYSQLSTNNWQSRHTHCFLDYDVKKERPSRVSVNQYYSDFCKGKGSKTITNISQKQSLKKNLTNRSPSGQSNSRKSSPLNRTKVNKSLPTYSQVQRKDDLIDDRKSIPTYSQFERGIKQLDDRKSIQTYSQFEKGIKHLDDRKSIQTYSQFEKGIKHHSSTKSSNSTKLSSSKGSNKSKAKSKVERGDQTENVEKEDLRCEILDYKIEINRLLQHITDLKVAARKYEEEKTDWIFEKRRQIQILQQLRDASYEETKAAMNLTSWKLADIQCHPKEYEEAKRNWLICKKTQIELLEKLRTVSLCEIKKNIHKICTPTGYNKSIDCDPSNYGPNTKSLANLISPNEICTDELYNNDHFSIKVCSPKNEFDSARNSIDNKYSINIMMKSNKDEFESFKNSSSSNVYNNTFWKLCREWSTKLDMLKSSVENSRNSNDSCTSSNEDHFISKPITNCKGIIKSQKNQSSMKYINKNINLEEMRKNIETVLGEKLFRNTYNLLKNLNCPDLILNSSNGDSAVAETVYKYILEENRINNNNYINDVLITELE